MIVRALRPIHNKYDETEVFLAGEYIDIDDEKRFKALVKEGAVAPVKVSIGTRVRHMTNKERRKK